MGFNRPLIVQFWDFATGAIVGDFGNSLHFKTPAMPLVLQRLPATVQLASAALLMAVVSAFPSAWSAALTRAARSIRWAA
jgi:peptide/nickel transport system permease protein